MSNASVSQSVSIQQVTKRGKMGIILPKVGMDGKNRSHERLFCDKILTLFNADGKGLE